MLSMFFMFGACAAGLTAVLLLLPGTAFNFAWQANPQAHDGLSGIGRWALLLMSAVALICVVAAVGLWRLKPWGLWTAVAVLAINLAADTVSAITTHEHRMLIGLPVDALLIAYLLSQRRRFLPERAGEAAAASTHQ